MKQLKNGDIPAPDYKWTGSEPKWIQIEDEPLDELKERVQDYMTKSFNFYNYYLQPKDFPQIIKSFMETRPCFSQKDVSKVDLIPSHISMVVVGAMSRMCLRGCPIFVRTCDAIEKMLKHANGTSDKPSVDKQTDVVSDEAVMRLRLSKTLMAVDQIVDSFTDDTSARPKKVEPIKVTLDENQLDEMSRDSVVTHIQKYIDAFLDDEQKEGFDYLTPKGIRNRVEILEGMKDDVDSWKKVRKARKPRAKKTMTADKQVRNLNFKQTSKDFSIESVNPTSIPMSHHLYVFNVKYRTLSVYHSSGTQGFEVKGSTLKRFDDKASYTVTLRKPEQILEEVSKRTPKQIEKILSGLTTKRKEANGRINGNSILFRVVDNKRPL
jgi:hypothetical protein